MVREIIAALDQHWQKKNPRKPLKFLQDADDQANVHTANVVSWRRWPAETRPIEDTPWEWIVEEKPESTSDQVAEANKDWPWGDTCPFHLSTQAPFCPNENAYAFNSMYFGGRWPSPQTCPLMQMPEEVMKHIMMYLSTSHRTLANFCCTSQTSFLMVMNACEHWDISRNHLNRHDFDPAQEGLVYGVDPFLIVSRFRNPAKITFETQVESLQKLSQALHWSGQTVQVLHLHRIPMLTTQLLSILIPNLKNLQMLGIYRCELIHVGHTTDLLDILRAARENDSEENIDLDFYPRFHSGPSDCYDQQKFSGSYGITWDNFGKDTRLAVWKLVADILPVAESQEVDLFSKDRAFRFWMDQSPLWAVEETIEVIRDCDSNEEIVAMVAYPQTRGKTGKLQAWSTQTMRCSACDKRVLGIFYEYNDWFLSARRPFEQTETCLGCKLKIYLDAESDHFKVEKNDIVRYWLRDNDGDLASATDEKARVRGIKRARAYDRLRQIRGLDVEKPNEKQRPCDAKAYKSACLGSHDIKRSKW